MTDQQALELAIETMRRQAYLTEPAAHDWRTYGDALQFNRTESRMAAEYADRLYDAATVLEALLARRQEPNP